MSNATNSADRRDTAHDALVTTMTDADSAIRSIDTAWDHLVRANDALRGTPASTLDVSRQITIQIGALAGFKGREMDRRDTAERALSALHAAHPVCPVCGQVTK